MIKKYCLYVVICLLLLFATTSTTYAKDTARIIFSSPTTTTKPGQIMVVNVTVDSNTPVNAVQAKILYPSEVFRLVSVNYTDSQFSIKADETISPGSIMLARGNIEPKTGKNLFATLVLQTITDGNISLISYSPTDSLVMSSEKNENILVNSYVATVKPQAARVNQQGPSVQPKLIQKSNTNTPASFFEYFIQEIKNSFLNLFK